MSAVPEAFEATVSRWRTGLLVAVTLGFVAVRALLVQGSDGDVAA